MKIFQTASTLTQAFKNAGRVREIMTVLVKHGFWDVMHRMQLSRFLPTKDKENPTYASLPVAQRLRMSFEELGPTFVKLGQLLATRSDLIPEEFVEEFEKLQDQVPAVPYSEIEKFLSTEWKSGLDSVFSEFDREPIAAASIAQVHGARLKTGEKVAVKIQRPGIEKTLHSDISILRGLAALLDKYVPETKPFNPIGLVDEFFQSILYELDFRVESNNIRKIQENLKELSQIVIPKVYAEHGTARVLVLERFEGIRFSDREAIVAEKIDPHVIIEAGCDAFFHMVMRDGLFHGDLHGGNLFILKDGKIGIIDFGIVGRLSRRVQDGIITMFIAIMDEDYETLANEYLSLCSPGGEVDVNQFQKDLMDTISPYVGMSLGEVNAGKILLRSTSIAAHHRLKVPRELMLLFRAIVTMDGIGKKIDPTFDILTLGTKLARQVITARYSKERLTKDFIILGRDLQDTLSTLPRLLKRFLRVWSHNNFAFETKSKDAAHLVQAVQQFSRHFVVSTAGIALVAVGIAFLLSEKGPTLGNFPLGAIISFGAAAYLFGSSLWKLKNY
jgi:ubiquinone biosynthesis protein